MPARDFDTQRLQAAAALRDFIQGRGGDWDWDDFTSCSRRDPRLESVRRRAGSIDLPVDDAGMAELRALLAQVEAM